MIRFSAVLVAVAVGLLVAGVVTSKLMLVYVAIGVSGVALLALAIGAVVKRRELFGSPEAGQPGPRAVPVPAAGISPVPPLRSTACRIRPGGGRIRISGIRSR